jgi:hypothetical protein
MAPDFFRLCSEWTDFFFSDDLEKDIQDNKQDNYNSFYLTPYNYLKVVIVNTSTLSFSVDKNQVLTPLLEDIYEELENEGFYPTKDGNIDHWGKQGILILNLHHFSTELFLKIKDKISQKEKVIWVIYGSTSLDINESLTFSNFLGSGIFKTINKKCLENGHDKVIY